jgi:predicted aspartyl protease
MSIRLLTTSTYGQVFLRNEECMGEIRVDVKLTNAADLANAAAGLITEEQVRSTLVQAIVDTGAVWSVIPRAVVDSIGAVIAGTEVAKYADGRQETVGRTLGIMFELLGRSTTDDALVLGDEVLIGQTVLEKLDLLADCKHQRLIPNPAHPDGPVARV